VALGNEIQRVRMVFKYAFDAGLIDRPIRYGPAFKRPGRATLCKARRAKGRGVFEAGEIRSMLHAAGQPLEAMILLGVNCGLGNSDVGSLPFSALDLNAGWVNCRRRKTALPRRCPLWPETIDALREAIAARPAPKDKKDRNLVFITKYGKPWAKASSDNPITKETVKLLKRIGLHRPGLGFYALRHTFRAIGGESLDQVAVDHIMGHTRHATAGISGEGISDERLRAVADHVRTWLFGETVGRRPGRS